MTLNGAGAGTRVEVATGECFSVPAGTWRSFAATGDGLVEIALITSGDQRKRPVWAPEIARGAMDAGFAIDHDGMIALLSLMPPLTLAAVTAQMLAAAE